MLIDREREEEMTEKEKKIRDGFFLRAVDKPFSKEERAFVRKFGFPKFVNYEPPFQPNEK